MARLLFTTTSSPTSALIRTFTWSDYSHVDLVFGNDIIAAVPFKGVVKDRVVDRLVSARKAVFYDIPCLDDDIAFEFASSQLGRPYDWSGVIGLGLHRDWQSQEKWFCSEFVEWVCKQSGHPLLAGDFRRITPQDLTLSPLIQLSTN